MDPCPFVRVLVGNLALRLPVASRPTKTAVHPSAAPCFCKIRLNKDPSKSAAVPLDSGGGAADPPAAPLPLAAAFSTQIGGKSSSIFAARCRIKIQIYTGRRGSTCGVSAGRLLGEVALPVDLKGAGGRPCVFYNGWIDVGKKGTKAKLHLTVRSEPDPRFVFEFGGEPECSPQVFQVQGSMKQPVFTCKFSCRNAGDRNGGIRSRSSSSESIGSRSWLTSAFGSDRERPGKERKGWSITVHDLSGSPVALASMVTPFVASPGTDRVSRSNPGAWLILRPGDGTWKPWARLEAWRERGPRDSLGYRFSLLPDTHICSGVSLAESSIGAGKGGRFTIDLTNNVLGRSPGCSPRGSGDFGYGMWPFAGGLVMSSTVGGEGKSSRPTVEVGVQHVGCSEDAAAYVALAAAVDLSMDACRLFSQKLRRELCQQQEDYCG